MVETEQQANMEDEVPVRVYMVEDIERFRTEVAEMLSSLGDFAVVGSAATEAEALEWFKAHPAGCDLAIIDLVLDQGTGMGVVRRCREHNPHAKIIVFSDYVTPVIRDYCVSLGADAAMPKTDLQGFVAFCQPLAPA